MALAGEVPDGSTVEVDGELKNCRRLIRVGPLDVADCVHQRTEP